MERTKRTRIITSRRSRARQLTTKDLDTLLRQVVLIRDGNRCRWCGISKRVGRGRGLEAAHIWPKGQFPWLRYDLGNVITLCHRCHFFRWHRSPLEAQDWIRRTMGTDTLASLRQVGLSRRGKLDYMAMKFYLEGELKKLLDKAFTFSPNS